MRNGARGSARGSAAHRRAAAVLENAGAAVEAVDAHVTVPGVDDGGLVAIQRADCAVPTLACSKVTESLVCMSATIREGCTAAMFKSCDHKHQHPGVCLRPLLYISNRIRNLARRLGPSDRLSKCLAWARAEAARVHGVHRHVAAVRDQPHVQALHLLQRHAVAPEPDAAGRHAPADRPSCSGASAQSSHRLCAPAGS